MCRRSVYWGAETFDAQDRIVNRSLIAEDVVFQLHPSTGEVLTSWGAGLFSMPHGLTIDWAGTVWVTDVGLHQVSALHPVCVREAML